MASRLAAGCMTGTSLDGLDVALVAIEGAGLSMSAKFIRAVSRPLGPVAEPLRRLADQQPMTAGDIARASRDFALLHTEALRELAGPDKLDLICIHGQTVFHQPLPRSTTGGAGVRPASSPSSTGLSWQLLNPFPIAHALRCPVVYDLRAADIAAGGQGAPITPIADWVFFGHLDGRTAIANLGGFCNITTLPARVTPASPSDPALIRGFDLCACNQLLDGIARKLLHQPFDADGARAGSGEVSSDALADLEGIFNTQRAGRRSLGTGDELHEWISRYRAHLPPEAIAATACEAIAQAIAEATRGCRRLLLAGGGLKNKTLTAAIRSCSSSIVEPTDAHGLPAGFREAAEFAVLGALCQDRIPITLPQVTGVPDPAPISGAWVFP
ncbi:MAG: anhydro-N-acetylmuramic acid kinase [Phycisphaerales bacterium]|nr:anhydro-N-acetylmuramic acid kinase [Phycisphaerales bacterium]